ncbi:hypothetical protein FXO38_34188 [Capsicum annuum]|nr:hypothetical protein FXO38_34188 [Capsicum annuum]
MAETIRACVGLVVGYVLDMASEAIESDIVLSQIRRLRNKEVPLAKVLCRNQSVEGATWEAEVDVRTKYPHLFSSNLDSAQGANTLPTGVTGWTPTQFIIRFMKKVLYAREGARSMMDWTFADFPWKVRVDVDGVDIEVPNVTGVPNIWGFRKLGGLHRAPDKFSIVAARNPVCNLALMVGTTDILDWCYFKAFGSEEKSNFIVAPSAEHLALFSDKSPISHVLDKFAAVATRNPVCNLSLMVGTTDISDWCYLRHLEVQKNKLLTVLSSSGTKAMEPEASTTQSMDNNATNVILAPLETISRDMAKLNVDFGTMREDMASMKGCVGSV